MNKRNLLLQLLALQVAISVGHERPSQNAPSCLQAPLILCLPQGIEHSSRPLPSSPNFSPQTSKNCGNQEPATNALTLPAHNSLSLNCLPYDGVSGPSPIGILNPILPVLPGPLDQTFLAYGLGYPGIPPQPSHLPYATLNQVHSPIFPTSHCLSHTLVPVNRQVVDECITNVPVVRKSIRHQEETITRHVPIVERTLTHQEEKIVRHVPVQHKSLHNVVEMRTHLVPVVKSRTRTVIEPYTVHVPITERFTRPVQDSITRNVPYTETVSRPLIYERTRYVPVTEKVLRPIIETNIYTVPVKKRYLKTIIEQRARPVRVPCEPCCAEQIEPLQISSAAIPLQDLPKTSGLPQLESHEDKSSSYSSCLTDGPDTATWESSDSQPFQRRSQALRIAPLALVPTGDLPQPESQADKSSAQSTHLIDAHNLGDIDNRSETEPQLSYYVTSKSPANIPVGNLADRISALSGATLGPIDYVSPYVTISECLT